MLMMTILEAQVYTVMTSEAAVLYNILRRRTITLAIPVTICVLVADVMEYPPRL